ncbi:MAG: TraR/DksA family transcriptional regulator [Planctomycetes bacterium]|nr:TraR/DksA family transcriptional regulator [Planctomycetota bacterium]
MAGKKNTKKDAPKTKTGAAPKKGLSAQDLAYFQELLLGKRRELLRNVTDIENGALRKNRLDASGDLSMMPVHMADLGTDNYEQEFALDLMDSERKVLLEIDQALARIKDKTYGICLGTEMQISMARLKAQPWTRFCIEHARKLENEG